MIHPEPKRCKSCAARIYWAKIEKGGKAMPVDEAPVERGNIRLLLRGRTIIGEVLAREVAELQTFKDIEEGRGPRLRSSHFATCEKARFHRKATR